MPVPFLLLDFDGVVCDTERAALLAWQDLYDRLGVPLDGEGVAGIRCVAVPWEPAGAPGVAGADAVLTSLAELDLRRYRRDGT